MLAPPGYAKIVSTPSRSRQATRISLPDIAGPTSGRPAADLRGFSADVFFALSVAILLICVCVAASGAGKIKKTHDRFQPWVLVEIYFNDKRQRRRSLRRRPAARLVDCSLTFAQTLSADSGNGQARI